MAAHRITSDTPYCVNVTNPFCQGSSGTAVVYENSVSTTGVGTGITLLISSSKTNYKR